jgi:phosphoenolpyruvate carboxykinase (ATP)
MTFVSKISQILSNHKEVYTDISREDMIRHSVENREAFISKNGALASWTPCESTGRSPKDTYIVKSDAIEKEIDWDSPNNIALAPDTFDMVVEDALNVLENKEKLYVSNRVIGADSRYALPVKTITSKAAASLFADNMFRPVPADIKESVFIDREFTLIALPHDKLDKSRYNGRVRQLGDGSSSDLIVAIDVERRIGVVYGSAYFGSMKKLMFTVMNYMLPGEGILPLHASANEGKDEDLALFLGLSGTGKTTLSADPNRALLGDDEHGWSDNGIANFENGCYAKLIDLNPEKEPEIYNAIMHEDDYLKHGALVENAMMYPDGSFDLYDRRLTENSRGSYPLSFLSNIKESSVGPHPTRILFLTADANGVLPPVAKLTEPQAMLWFLMGYTSKLAGTETGITEPVSTFSRFFGSPFMPRNPEVYASMLGERMKKHGTEVYLVNTGWSGGPYGVGKRMDINITRAIVNGVLDTDLSTIEFVEDKLFHIMVPKTFPGVDSELLHPKNTWDNIQEFEKRARQLATDFSNYFDKAYGNKNIDPGIQACCPGK